ncbi:hypothetical protein DERF_009599 [Dermatophagoides farinae]|uniref:Uncharacterized protein n=1 Tax=Dermatophagoides farinae TaxID=6954 RepID=A0A922HWR1_DERFA|nr:hypothetical protein DERF_009599 [Dermatophagoides farinae]
MEKKQVYVVVIIDCGSVMLLYSHIIIDAAAGNASSSSSYCRISSVKHQKKIHHHQHHHELIISFCQSKILFFLAKNSLSQNHIESRLQNIEMVHKIMIRLGWKNFFFAFRTPKKNSKLMRNINALTRMSNKKH